MQIVVMVAQLLLGISILVGLHELGHLLAAKLFKMRVEKYFIGFPPKVFGFKWGETEYALGAIPLGGFVKITGMVDESLDTAALSATPEPYEFRAKPAWQRLIVMLGGIIVNVVTGIIIFAWLVYDNGEKYYPASEGYKYGIVAGELAEKIGLKTGDKILKVNGKEYSKFYDVMSPEVLLGSSGFYTVERGGQIFDVQIPADLAELLSDSKNRNGFIDIAKPYEIGQLRGGFPAEKAGLKAGDKIVSVNGVATPFFHLLQEQLQANKEKSVSLSIDRAGQVLNINCEVTEDGKLGFQPNILLAETTVQYGIIGSIPKGMEMAYDIIDMQVRGFGKIFKGEVSAKNSLQGPISMAQDLYGGIWDWDNFWRITGLISLALAFFNLLPIPALDGGHATFLIFEMISGRKPSDIFLERAQKVGMVLLLSLMVFVIFNDIFKHLF